MSASRRGGGRGVPAGGVGNVREVVGVIAREGGLARRDWAGDWEFLWRLVAQEGVRQGWLSLGCSRTWQS